MFTLSHLINFFVISDQKLRISLNITSWTEIPTETVEVWLHCSSELHSEHFRQYCDGEMPANTIRKELLSKI